jgi:hypothetical protein
MSIAARRSHRGDEYQLAVAVHWLIRLLADPDVTSVQVDAVSLPSSPDNVDVDDIVIAYGNAKTRHVQAKKNQPSHRRWQISDSDLKEELVKTHRQLQKTPDAIIEFCSHTPFGDLAALAESARDYGNHGVFETQASSNLKMALAKLGRILGCTGEIAFGLVQHIEIGDAHNFAGWEARNRSTLEALVNDPDTAMDVLGRMARGNQSGLLSPPGPLDRDQVVQALCARNVLLRRNSAPLEADQVSRAFASASIDLASWKTTLPNEEWLERPELDVLRERIADEPTSLTLVLGEPGCGKSALLARLAREHIARGVTVLAIKADYLSEDIVDTPSLGDYLHLPADPIDCVATLARDAKVLVIVDQLDALADLVVQHSSRLRAPIDLIRGLSEMRNVHIVASCRVFEHRHDTRLRNLEAETITLDLPLWDEVEATLKKYGINAGGWNASIREDLRSPQTLNLFLQLIGTANEADLLLGYQHMLGELWKQQVLSDASGRAREVLFSIAEQMAEREMLWLPEALFDANHHELQQLFRSGILVCQAGRVGFRHQTLYEYIRARSFLAKPGQLSDTVLSRQNNLRIRPLLWHSLAYMRAVDRPAYVREIEKLWHTELRPHLKMLLIEFLGQLPDPETGESALVAQKWNDPWYRNRILATVPGSPGWFEWLADTCLPEIMQLPTEQARAALPVLWLALTSHPHRVLELVSHHWQPVAEKDLLTLFVLEHLTSWDEPCVRQCRQIFERTKLPDWQVNHIISEVSATTPEQAPSLIDAWLRQETSGTRQHAEKLDRIASILNGRELHDLPAIAEAAPQAFMQAVWPWVLEAIHDQAQEAHQFLIGFCHVDTRFPDLDDTEVRRHKPFIAAIFAAIKTMAAQTPEGFLDFLRNNRHIDLMPVQQLLALGLSQAAARFPAEALEFLLEDPRRLVIGTYRDSHADSKRLIRAISPHLDTTQIRQLEQVICGWNRYGHIPDEDAGTRRKRQLWTREHRLRLLRAVPEERMSESCKRHVAEEERAFPDLDDVDVHMSGFREIRSPMDATSMQRASDAEILNLFAELTDQTQWDHPRHAMRGGVIQASRELAGLAKTSPEKAIRLIRQMQPGRDEIAVGAVLQALGENKLDARALYSLVLELSRKGFVSGDFRQGAANAIGAVVSSDSPLSGELFELLSSWLGDASGDDAASGEEEDKDPSGSILWSHGGFVVVPHGNYTILSTLTNACLCLEPPQSEAWLSLLEGHLARKEQLKVWKAVSRHLRWLECADHDRAQRFLLDLFTAYPELLNHESGVMLLAHSQCWLSAKAAHDLFDCLFATGTDFATQAAGELIMLRFALKGGEEPGTMQWLERCLTGIDADCAPVHTRIGIAYAAAELWRETNVRNQVHPYLLQLLDSGEEKVVAAAARVFAQRQMKPDTCSRELLEFLQGRPRLLGQIADDDLGECMMSMLATIPLVVANVARSLLDAIGDDFFSHTTSRYFLAEHLLTTSLRLQEMGTPHQELGAHIFERMLEFNTPEARNIIFDLDKRTANAGGSPSARRRRKRTQ